MSTPIWFSSARLTFRPICVHISIFKQIIGVHPFGPNLWCVFLLDALTANLWGPISRRFSWNPIDLPMKFLIGNVILHVLAENKRYRIGRRFLAEFPPDAIKQNFTSDFRYFYYIPIDLCYEFLIENIILHLLAKNGRNRRGHRSLLNPC